MQKIKTPDGKSVSRQTLWGISESIGGVSLMTFVLLSGLLLLRDPVPLTASLARLVPNQWREAFDRTLHVSTTPNHGGIMKVLDVVGPRKIPQAAANHLFTMGSSKDMVARVQGQPSSKTDTVWMYGNSEVQFIGGRVVAWRNAPRNPLRVR
jgi:hypothetical protein